MKSFGFQRPLASVLGIGIVLQACVLSAVRLDYGDWAVKEDAPENIKTIKFQICEQQIKAMMYMKVHHK